jgi:hypothetical protein
MKTNPVKQFLDDVKSILEPLSKLVDPGETTGVECRAYSLYFMSMGKVHVRFNIQWDTNIDFNNCAEWWLPRLLCRLAHGDQCGSAEYASLKRSAKKAYADVLKHFQGSEFIEKNTYSNFKMDRERVRLYFSLTAEMSDLLLSQQLLEVKEGIVSKIPKSGGKSQTYDNENTPMFFAGLPELLSEELGIQDVKVYYYA